MSSLGWLGLMSFWSNAHAAQRPSVPLWLNVRRSGTSMPERLAQEHDWQTRPRAATMIRRGKAYCYNGFNEERQQKAFSSLSLVTQPLCTANIRYSPHDKKRCSVGVLIVWRRGRLFKTFRCQTLSSWAVPSYVLELGRNQQTTSQSLPDNKMLFRAAIASLLASWEPLAVFASSTSSNPRSLESSTRERRMSEAWSSSSYDDCFRKQGIRLHSVDSDREPPTVWGTTALPVASDKQPLMFLLVEEWLAALQE